MASSALDPKTLVEQYLNAPVTDEASLQEPKLSDAQWVALAPFLAEQVLNRNQDVAQKAAGLLGDHPQAGLAVLDKMLNIAMDSHGTQYARVLYVIANLPEVVFTTSHPAHAKAVGALKTFLSHPPRLDDEMEVAALAMALTQLESTNNPAEKPTWGVRAGLMAAVFKQQMAVLKATNDAEQLEAYAPLSQAAAGPLMQKAQDLVGTAEVEPMVLIMLGANASAYAGKPGAWKADADKWTALNAKSPGDFNTEYCRVLIAVSRAKPAP